MQDLHAHAIFGPPQQPRDLDPHERRHLRGRVKRQRVFVQLRQADERLQRRVGDRLGAKRMLEHALGRRKGRVNIAAAQLIVERDVGVLAPRQMLEIGEGAGGLQLVMHDHR